jgi:hypothetical protein
MILRIAKTRKKVDQVANKICSAGVDKILF